MGNLLGKKSDPVPDTTPVAPPMDHVDVDLSGNVQPAVTVDEYTGNVKVTGDGTQAQLSGHGQNIEMNGAYQNVKVGNPIGTANVNVGMATNNGYRSHLQIGLQNLIMPPMSDKLAY